VESAWQCGGLVVGRVVAFDEHVGLGEIECQSRPGPVGADGPPGGERVPFHCVSIADGSRSVELGAEVAFLLRLGRDGREWAAGIVVVAERVPGA
jgi:hypothetical protein